ncbi:MAG: transposase family protein, partial [Rhodobacteraceae bacterium]|nr:transposase family protein [Paracoccaceae bacterium]
MSAEIDDPRQAAKVLFPLEEIFLLVLCAVISGADGWSSIALYGRKKVDFLR